jgi:hypothetical protein
MTGATVLSMFWLRFVNMRPPPEGSLHCRNLEKYDYRGRMYETSSRSGNDPMQLFP